MNSAGHSFIQSILGFAQGWLAPILAVAISIVYFRASPKTQALVLRLVASAHGVSIALLYFGALSFLWRAKADPALETAFFLISLIPVALIGVSFAFYRGGKLVHFLQIPNALCLL